MVICLMTIRQAQKKKKLFIIRLIFLPIHHIHLSLFCCGRLALASSYCCCCDLFLINHYFIRYLIITYTTTNIYTLLASPPLLSSSSSPISTTNVCRKVTIYTAATQETSFVYQANYFTVIFLRLQLKMCMV